MAKHNKFSTISLFITSIVILATIVTQPVNGLQCFSSAVPSSTTFEYFLCNVGDTCFVCHLSSPFPSQFILNFINRNTEIQTMEL